MKHQILHVRVAIESHKIQSPDLPKFEFVLMLHNFPPFVGPNFISEGLTNGLSIRQLLSMTVFLARVIVQLMSAETA